MIPDGCVSVPREGAEGTFYKCCWWWGWKRRQQWRLLKRAEGTFHQRGKAKWLFCTGCFLLNLAAMLIFGECPVSPPSTGTGPKKIGPWQRTLSFSVFPLLSVWVCVKITHSNRWHTVGWAGAFLLGSQAPFGFPGPHMGCGRALKGAGSYSISVQPTPSPSASNHFCTQFCPLVFLFLSVEFNEIAFFLFSLSNCNQVQWF